MWRRRVEEEQKEEEEEEEEEKEEEEDKEEEENNDEEKKVISRFRTFLLALKRTVREKKLETIFRQPRMRNLHDLRIPT